MPPSQQNPPCLPLPRASSSAPGGSGAGMLDASTNGRGRSGSPTSCRVLASDVRRFARGLKHTPATQSDTSLISSQGPATPPHGRSGGGGSGGTSVDPGPRPGSAGSAGSTAGPQSLFSVARIAVQQQVTPLADRLNAAINQLQDRTDGDSRRLEKLERKVSSQLEELRAAHASHGSSSAAGGGRESVAEVHGVVSGLMDEMKVLTSRVESLDERLWARTGGVEAEKKRSRELEQQVQVLEHQGRLAASSAEETQRRQVARLKRVESNVEESLRRVMALEEDLRHGIGGGAGGVARRGHDIAALEGRILVLENQQQKNEADLLNFQAQVEEELHRQGQPISPESCGSPGRVGSCDLDELEHIVSTAVSRITEQRLVELERRTSTQVQDMASSLATMRVKLDGQVQRAATLAERLETAHGPAVEAMRDELGQARTQDWNRVENELAKLRGCMREVVEEVAAEEGHVDACARESIQNHQAEMSGQLRELDERMAAELNDLRAHMEALMDNGESPPAEPSGDAYTKTSHTVGFAHHASDEEEADVRGLRHRMQQMQDAFEQLSNDLWHAVSDVDNKIAEVGHATSTLAADFASASGVAMGPTLQLESPEATPAAVLGDSGVHSPRATDGSLGVQSPVSGRDASWEVEAEALDAESSVERQIARRREQEMDAVAERLRATDALAARVARLEHHAAAAAAAAAAAGVGAGAGASAASSAADGHSGGGYDGVHSGSGGSGVAASGHAATGSSATARSARVLQTLAQEVSELQARLLASHLALQMGKPVRDFDYGCDGANGRSYLADEEDQEEQEDGATPREEEIIALAEKITEAEQDFTECLPTDGDGRVAESKAAPVAYDETFAAPSARSSEDCHRRRAAATSSHKHGVPGSAGATVSRVEDSDSEHVDVEKRAGGRGAGNDCGGTGRDGLLPRRIALQDERDQALSPHNSAAIDGDHDANGAAAAAAVPFDIFSDQLSALEEVLRSFAGRLDALGDNSGGTGGAQCAPLAENEEVWAQMEDLKAHVSMSLGNLQEQHRDLEDARALVRVLAEQVAALHSNVDYTRHQGDQTNSECKALGQRLRIMQERDLPTVFREAGHAQDSVNDLAHALSMSEQRLDVVEAATLALKQDVAMVQDYYGSNLHAISASRHAVERGQHG
eukprot:TRINITY_DN8625_c0_g1_i1.p1 TRINITY_DN8625_c0_g1~~TRINITY_DN8625_c0_g1_i1.p1  ORF type:complete len:1155 (+),score=248.23 TRINITY_DN8625_c0_g1_i1:95-3559(+)